MCKWPKPTLFIAIGNGRHHKESDVFWLSQDNGSNGSDSTNLRDLLCPDQGRNHCFTACARDMTGAQPAVLLHAKLHHQLLYLLHAFLNQALVAHCSSPILDSGLQRSSHTVSARCKSRGLPRPVIQPRYSSLTEDRTWGVKSTNE